MFITCIGSQEVRFRPVCLIVRRCIYNSHELIYVSEKGEVCVINLSTIHFANDANVKHALLPLLRFFTNLERGIDFLTSASPNMK